MDARLHEAALKGDADSLTILLEENAQILDGAAVAETPLHIAAIFGHVEFAEVILNRKPELARVLDSGQSSPLHLASEKGHVEMVKELLKIHPDMCLVRDQDGRTPLHVASLKGRVEVVKVLVHAKGIATRVLTDRREPILHLCVNHNRFESVKSLLECVENGKDDEFVYMKDDDDNTLLHLAVAKKHIPLTKCLLKKAKMRAQLNALNVHGFTALDVSFQNGSKWDDMKLEGILLGAGAKRADAMHRTSDEWTMQRSSPRKNMWTNHTNWLNKTRSTLMVVAILISSITFQAGINPPGGFWQEDTKDHFAGKSIMAKQYPYRYKLFTISNTIGFIASLIIILMLITAFPLKRWIFMWALMIITWLSVSSMIFTYGQAFLAISTSEVLELWRIFHIPFRSLDCLY